MMIVFDDTLFLKKINNQVNYIVAYDSYIYDMLIGLILSFP